MNRKYFYIAVAVALIAGGFAAFNWLIFPSNDGLPLAQASEVVELQNGDTYELVASPVKKEIGGKTYTMLAYNGSIPGPLIKIPQGVEVTIHFKNDTDMPTLLHSHGVRMDNQFDGSQTTQKDVEPGGTFSYKLKFPDAGVYWYHPHVREDYQQELGLYGNYLVVPSDKNYWNSVNREVALFLDDILIENGSTSLTTGGKINLSTKGTDRTLMGRFGNVMLINGEDDYMLNVKKGETVRLYVTNAANARPFNFAIAGANLKLVGADGGAYEKESWADSVILGPSERAIVEVLLEKSGTYAIENQTPEKTYELGEVVVSDESIVQSYAADFGTLRSHQETTTSIDPLRSIFNKTPDKRLALTVDMMGAMMGGMGGHPHSPKASEGHSTMQDGTQMSGMGMMGGVPEGGIEWEDADMQMMNQMSNVGMIKWNIVDQDTGKKNMDIDWAFKKGEPAKIRIFNDPKSGHPMQHPIHFHGQRFLVVARDGMPQTNLVWKDTVLVKAGETVDIVLDTSNPGVWMAHCHIAEHLEAGMMMKFEVE
ncbi:multicopper oxidase family protein [Candidatus Kaiserbacteria bacterium]|nr:multicopper oxidase family protein [Candidatus Kaiserbacteria bacterium]